MSDICTGTTAASPCAEGCISVGYAFVPPQDVDRFYDYEAALISGSVFPDLIVTKGNYGPKENFYA